MRMFFCVIVLFLFVSRTPAEEYLITANRIPEDPAKSTADITILDTEELDEKQSEDLNALLTALPPFLVAEYGSWAGSSIRLGGSSSKNLLILLDGIPLINPTGIDRGFSLPNFSMSGIRRVEVVRGANSALYGSNAVTGVINLMTSPERDRSGLSLGFKGGSHGYYMADAEWMKSYDRGSYILSGEYMQAEGYNISPAGDEKDGARSHTLSASVNHALSDNFSMTGRCHLAFSSSDYDAWTHQAADAPLTDENINFLAALKGEGELFSRHRSSFSLSFNRARRLYEDNGTETDRYEGNTLRLSFQDDYAVTSSVTITAGSDLSWESARQITSYDYNMERRRLFIPEVFTGISVHVSESLSLNGALRYLHSDTGDKKETFVYKGGLRWDLPLPLWDSSLALNYGTSFNLPTLFQLYGKALDWMTSSPITVGNPDLKPEEGQNLNILWENALIDDHVFCDFFWSREIFEDYIAMDYSANTYVNHQSAEIQNFEIRPTLVIRPGKWELSLFSHLIFTQATDTTDGSKKELPMVPEQTSQIGIRAAHKPVSVSLYWNRTGQRLAGYPVLEMPAYSLLNAAMTWNVSSQVSLQLKGDNLADEKYRQTVELVDSGFGPVPTITEVSGYVHYPGYQTPGRSFQAGITYFLPVR